jgi:ferrous iron transport protein A
VRGLITIAKRLGQWVRRDTASTPSGPVPVTLVAAGKDVRIAEVNMCACGCMNVRRLGEMGIYPGAELRVATGGGGAPTVLQSDDSRIALDSHQAREITVLPVVANGKSNGEASRRGEDPEMRLSECRPGQSVTIASVHGEGPVVQRLMEMGLIEGATIKLIRSAPLGDPIEIEVQEYFLTLRKEEAEHLEIRT